MSFTKRYNRTQSLPNITTEGIKYTGSKKLIIPYILKLVDQLDGIETVLDGFSGTTRVAQAFAQRGHSTTANDISVWSEVFGNCYLIADKPDSYYQEILDHLNGLEGVDGWFSEHYGANGNLDKRPFQLKNSRKLDAIREEIDRLNFGKIDQSVLLTSLILALDRVDSTMGHYAAYLSKWSPRSFNDLTLLLPRRFNRTGKNRVIKGDIFDTISEEVYDLAYFDPPYGSNNEKMPPSRVRYAAYYHLWTSVILNDKPTLFGKANRREDSRDQLSASIFEEFRKNNNDRYIAMEAIERLIQNTKARYILLSYSSGGRATRADLHQLLNENGKLIQTVEVNHRLNIMSSFRTSNEWIMKRDTHKEYLFLLKKQELS